MKSIRTKYFLEKCLAGLNFLAIGLQQHIAYREGWDSLWIPVCGMVILGYVVYQNILSGRMKFEPEDEMTKRHEDKAQAGVYKLLCILLAVVGLICMFNAAFRGKLYSMPFSWMYLFYLLGILQIIEYIVFLLIERYERYGDPIE
ncbi:MAG: hypothetical protein Q4D32_11565 [Eubacteriales bacterium]|nr:hypothetical protein [Eubacteriales bacterium]